MTAITPAPTPTISGVPVFGYTLAAVLGTWANGVTFTYQWKRDNVAIVSATSSTYLVGIADVGHAISVTVTGTKAGYDVTSVTSSATALITNYILPSNGDNNWDVPLSNSIVNLDTRLTTVENTTTTLSTLSNVRITNPTDGQVLKYQASTGLWINSN
jgi:hypothetical protein